MLIGAAWAINLAFYQASQLKEPIVLDHYIDVPMNQTPFFTIYYLTNKKNPAILQSMEVNGLSIPNIAPSNDMWLFENQNTISNSPNIVQEFTHHILLEAHFDPSMLSPEGVEDKSFTMTDSFLTFNDGTAKQFDIGEIHVTASGIQQEPILSGMWSGGTSDGLHTNIFVAEQQVHMNEIVLPEYISKDVVVKVEYKGENEQVSDPFSQTQAMPNWDALDGLLANEINWPIALNQRSSVGFYVQIDSSNSKAIDARVKWNGETAEGLAFSTFVSLAHRPQLADGELHKLIEKAREGS